MRPLVVRAAAGGARRLHRPFQAAPEGARLPFQLGHAKLVDQSDDDDESDEAGREDDQAPRGAVHGSIVVDGWPLAVGSWPLAVGRWPLAVGSWQLAVGSWQLAVVCL